MPLQHLTALVPVDARVSRHTQKTGGCGGEACSDLSWQRSKLTTRFCLSAAD